MIRLHCLTLTFLGLGFGLLSPAWANGPDLSKVRGGLPEPTPAISVAFAGDLIEQGIWVGEVEYALKAAVVATQATWRAVETYYYDGTGGEVREQRRLALDRDLSLASGTIEFKRLQVTTSLAISRTAKGYSILSTTRTEEGNGEPTEQSLETKAAPLHGQMALLQLLRALSKTSKNWVEVPWLAIDGQSPISVTTIRVRARGEGRAGQGDAGRDTFVFEVEQASQVFAYHLDRATRGLVAIEAPQGLPHVAPVGAARARAHLDEYVPARNWEQAFLKFGYGYHMAREELIDEAFHWESMYAYEIDVAKRWSKDRGLEEFKRAWIDEFVANSLHRSRVDAGRLLAMTLSSGKVVKETDSTVVFAAHATFGGGVQRTYYFEKFDDVWRLTRVDF